MHDVKDSISLDVTMPALVEVEDDTSVSSLFEQTFDLGVRALEKVIQILDTKV
jgi:hypothetical protein